MKAMDAPLPQSLVLSHRQCPKKAWLQANGAVREQAGIGQRAMIEQGRIVRATGRLLFKGGVPVSESVSAAESLALTETGLGEGKTLFAASFNGGGLALRVDVACPGQEGLRLVEIASGGRVKDSYLDACAMKYACVTAAGHAVESVAVMHPNTAATMAEDGCGADVLVVRDVTERVLERSAAVGEWVAQCRATISGGEPAIEPGEQCNNPHACVYAAHCGQPAVDSDPDRVEFLPQKSGRVRECLEGGITRVSDMPPDAVSDPRNRVVYEAITRKRAVVMRGAARIIAQQPFPRYFIDFESAGFAVPRHAGMKAHEALPFQWSCHRVDEPGYAPVHSEFLDVSGDDPRRGFVESLVKALGADGPVFVYSAFERTRLKELAKTLPDLKGAIMGVIGRLVDLLPLARRGFYAPAQLGSWSIKAILPCLPAAEWIKGYEDLGEVADGLAAQAMYQLLVDPSVVGIDRDAARLKMLGYCATDTAGLVHLVDCVTAALEGKGGDSGVLCVD